MAIKIYQNFSFNAVDSSTYGIINAKVSDTNSPDPFLLSDRRIIEQRIRGKSSPYFIEIEENPISFNMELCLKDTFEPETDINPLTRWLKTDYYAPMCFYDDSSSLVNKYYYVLLIDVSNIYYYGKNGYISANFRLRDPFCLSAPITSITHTSPTTITITNPGDMTIYPELYITKTVSNGNISIKNTSNSDQELTFTNIDLDEVLYVNCSTQYISTDKVATYRYDKNNDVFTEFLVGDNILEMTGTFDITFKYSYRYNY